MLPNLEFSVTGTSVSLLLALIAYILYSRYVHGLRNIPGPFSASFSNWLRIKAAWRSRMTQENVALHKKYGPLVRLGPNTVSVDDPAALNIIYGFKPAYNKTGFYSVAETFHKGNFVPTLFTTRSEAYHSQLKRASAHAYTVASLTECEPAVQALTQLFLQRIDDVTKGGKLPIDMGAWLHYFAWDAVGEVSFSERLGFLETGADVGKCIATVEGFLLYLSIIGQAPWLHKVLLGNKYLHALLPAIERSNEVQNLVIKMIDKRINGEQVKDRCDILSRFIEASGKGDSKLSYTEMLGLLTTNAIAGPGTIAVALRATLYYLCRTPTAYTKLQSEVDTAFTTGSMASPANYTTASKLPYLTAVINEALRMHPITGFILERIVPAEGATIAGHLIPGGTIIGINAWTMHSNTSVFGEDAHMFRPERWLDADEPHLREMKRCMMAFGAGPRVCAGRNVALMQIYVLVLEMVRRFDFRLVDEDREWEVMGHWFTKQTGLDMYLTKRHL